MHWLYQIMYLAVLGTVAILPAVSAWTTPRRQRTRRRSNNLFSSESFACYGRISSITALSTSREQEQALEHERRQFLSQCLSRATVASLGFLGVPRSTLATEETSSPSSQQQQPYIKQADKFGYIFQPPNGFDAGNKPLKTHLDEINFKSLERAGYQFGITVDPVRITSLQQFGTPQEVAAKVVMAEVNRDGVFDVTLMQDPIAGPGTTTELSSSLSFYQLNYLSSGKRGEKRFVTKFYIQNQFLFALTAQCKEVDYKTLEAEMLQAVESFQVI